jgi:hypothetical protein
VAGTKWPVAPGARSSSSKRRFRRGGTGENFLLFLGRNTGTGMEKFEEFYPLDSAKGQAIVRNLARINPEQPLFWEDYP